MAHKFDVNHKQKLDSAERKKLLPPEAVLQSLNISPGEVIADIGCGTGYFAILAAHIIGDDGKVFALDISDEMLAEVRQRAKMAELTNVETVTVQEYNFPLPAETVTLCFMAFVLHESDNPSMMVQEAKRILKPTGQIAILEWEKKEALMGPPINHRLSREEVIDYLTRAGFEEIEANSFGPEFYSIRAKKIR